MSLKLVASPSFPRSTAAPALPHLYPSEFPATPSLNRFIRSRRDPPTAILSEGDGLWGDSGKWFDDGEELSAGRPGLRGREMPTQPERILDAPDIVDDYYLNLLDWSQKDVLAVALKSRLFLWNAQTSDVSQLTETSGVITSVAWSPDGLTLAVGDSASCVTLYDVNVGKAYQTLLAHRDRVSALAWNGAILSSGSRDATIVHSDVRAESSFLRTLAHTQEVCGLKWSLDGSQLASGGNDNRMCVWEAVSATPRFLTSQHRAAVKALSWCPWRPHILASGGGTADRTIKIWNTATNVCLQSVDTGSQVCALEWNRHGQELLSAHGYAQNQLSLWSWPQLTKVAEFTGHSARVLFLAQNPLGSTVVSAGADETLRFWRIFASSIPACKPCSDVLPYECR